MNSINLTSKNWIPVSPKYSHDDGASFKNVRTFSAQEGVSLSLCDLSTSTLDVKNNNFSTLYLTEKSQLTDIIEFDSNIPEYPEQFITYFIHGAFDSVTPASKYWVIEESTTEDFVRSFAVSGTNSDISNRYYFHVNLISDNQLSVSHDDNYSKTYLTYNNATSACTFKEDRSLDISLSGTQLFEYFIDKKTGFIILVKDKKYLIRDKETDELIGSIAQSKATGYPIESVIRITPYTRTDPKLTVANHWYSYKNIPNENTLKVNENKSISNITNNYILHTEYHNLTGTDLNINILPLKNQLTPNHNQSRQQPFPHLSDVDFRLYNKIFSGTNQVTGHKNIYLSYGDYTTEFEFKPDKLTYFHSPQNMYPYKSINVNDTGLINAGAIGADTPLKSDKIFQKAAGYKDSTPWGDTVTEHHGQWLCTWLKSDLATEWNDETIYNENTFTYYKDVTYKCIKDNINKDPSDYINDTYWESGATSSMWVDRYYNPAKFTTTQAMAMSGYYNYKDGVTSIIERLEAENDIVFDVQSSMRFEPGSLYAYYRVGHTESKGTVESQKENLLLEDLDVYEQYTGAPLTPNKDDKGNKIYTFNGENYGTFKSITELKNSDFSVSFWLYNSDWSKPFASQVVGNYINEGFGVFNREDLTPILTFRESTEVIFTNTDLTTINTLSSDNDFAISSHMLEDVYTINGTTLDQYDRNNILKERTDISSIDMVNCQDISYDDDNIYFLINESVSGIDKVAEKVLDTSTISPIKIGSGASTKLLIYDDAYYTTSYDIIDIDNDKNVWYVDSNIIYKYNAVTSTTIAALNTSDTITDLKIDYYNNIWCLLTDGSTSRVVKFSSDREKLLSFNIDDTLSVDLSGVDLTDIKRMELLNDFNSGSLNEHIALLNQDDTGSTSIIRTTLKGSYVDSTLDAITLSSPISSYRNISTYQNIRSKKSTDSNKLHFKIKLTNPYNLDDIKSDIMDIDVKDFTAEWHHFCYTFNGDNGSITLYVDGQLYKTAVTTTQDQKTRYKFTNTLKAPFSVGTNPYFNNTLTSDLLQQSTANMANNIQVKGLRLYDNNLNLFSVKALSREFNTIHPVQFILPGGKRNYIDHMTKLYRHRHPGHKSNDFNLNITSGTITETSLKADLKDKINLDVSKLTPINTNLKTVNWI